MNVQINHEMITSVYCISCNYKRSRLVSQWNYEQQVIMLMNWDYQKTCHQPGCMNSFVTLFDKDTRIKDKLTHH